METQPVVPPAASVGSYLPAIESLLRQILRSGGFRLTFIIRRHLASEGDPETPEFVVDLSGPDADLLLEKNAVLLDALEYVVLKAVRLDEDLFGKITFDCGDWRRVRAQELLLTAQVAAERVIQTGDPYVLNPMSPRERRIIHLALKDLPQVGTRSEGAGPQRRVVIVPVSSPSRAARP